MLKNYVHNHPLCPACKQSKSWLGEAAEAAEILLRADYEHHLGVFQISEDDYWAMLELLPIPTYSPLSFAS